MTSIPPYLLIEIANALGAAAALGYASAPQANDVYETYVWSICLTAARNQGASVIYRDVNGTATSSLIFRTSPGDIYSKAHMYTHAELTFQNRPSLELHVGVKVQGTSKVLHECDIAVIDKGEANTCRLNGVHPRARYVLLAAECKFYASTLSLGLGRGFMGLAFDIQRPGRYFVSNNTSVRIENLLVRHNLEWEMPVVPGNSKDTALQVSFEKSFRDYKVKTRP